jgi:succinate-acetate transporter protein
VFATLAILFFLLAAHFFNPDFSVKVAAVEGILCGAAAAYGSAAVVLNAQFGRWLFPIGLLSE